MWISFAWTTDALLALRKTCTRRNWTDDYATKFIRAYDRGESVDAYNKNPRNGGKKVGQIRLTCAPYKESMGKFPAADYENEGFMWMEEHNLKIQGLHPLDFCQQWINTNEEVWIVRFRPIRLDTSLAEVK
jgi:hypothetical protein